MALAGDEKRIRALFSELSLEDQSCAPRFERLWSQAEKSGNTRPAQARRFTASAAMIALTAVAVIAAAALAVWSWSATSTNPSAHNAVNAINIAPQVTEPAPLPAMSPSNNAVSFAPPRKSHPRYKRSFEKDRIAEASATEAAMLSHWQSPTDILMTSPTTVVLNSLPQLDESAEELKQFLPKKTDTMKESNQ